MFSGCRRNVCERLLLANNGPVIRFLTWSLHFCAGKMYSWRFWAQQIPDTSCSTKTGESYLQWCLPNVLILPALAHRLNFATNHGTPHLPLLLSAFSQVPQRGGGTNGCLSTLPQSHAGLTDLPWLLCPQSCLIKFAERCISFSYRKPNPTNSSPKSKAIKTWNLPISIDHITIYDFRRKARVSYLELSTKIELQNDF